MNARAPRLVWLVVVALLLLALPQSAQALSIHLPILNRGDAALDAAAVIGPTVEPIFVEGNPSCSSLGYALGFKPNVGGNESFVGTYTFPFPGDSVNTVTVTSDGIYVDWASTLGIDAVIVKGGPNANVYVYAPPAEAFGDTGLHAPMNGPAPYGMSHVEFCYDYEVVVTKDAHTTYTRTFAWTIDKSVTPDTWALFNGDSGVSTYTVSVVKDAGTDSGWAVHGTITIHNPHPSMAAMIDGVSDMVDGMAAVVSCPVTFPAALPAGGTLECIYSLPLSDASSRLNTAVVTTSGLIGGGVATADVIFGAPTTIVDNEITVSDTNAAFGGPFITDASMVWTYAITFLCGQDAGMHPNTAAFVTNSTQTTGSDSASVAVACYDLTVTKTAPTKLTRTWSWSIDKRSEISALTLSTGQIFTAFYDVTVGAAYVDSDWAVEGVITIVNNHPTMAADLTAVSDLIAPDIMAMVSCPAMVVPAGGSIACTYAASLPDAALRLNTATAVQQNYAYDGLGGVEPSGTTGYSGSANVDFAQAVIAEIDECIDVSDDHAGVLGTVCAADAPKTFTYSLDIGPYTECGRYEFVNVASFLTNDTGATGSDSWTVVIDIPCGGCTLTPGYWKTHSLYGPAPYDETWAMIGEDTPFFLSGLSYYQALWAVPSGGNVYYILAHPWIAAKLNILNGAAVPAEVLAALDNAETNFFMVYTPEAAAKLKGATRTMWVEVAELLDAYNNGYVGPGHCSE